MTAITCERVRTTYGDVTALDDLDLQVERGTALGLLGPNGAGKTTLLELLAGLRRPQAGSVRVLGRAPADSPRLRDRIGYLPDRAGFPDQLTGREVLAFHARMRSVPADERDRRIARTLRTVGLAADADRAVGGYSNGMCRRLGLATTLLADPAVLLLDEPTAGLDPDGTDALRDVLADLTAETSITLVLTSHALADVEAICDAVALLEGGQIATRTAVEAVADDATQSVDVSLTYADTDAAAAVADALCAADSAADVELADSRVAVAADPGAVDDVLATAREVASATRVSVDEPGVPEWYRDVATGRGGVSP